MTNKWIKNCPSPAPFSPPPLSRGQWLGQLPWRLELWDVQPPPRMFAAWVGSGEIQCLAVPAIPRWQSELAALDYFSQEQLLPHVIRASVNGAFYVRLNGRASVFRGICHFEMMCAILMFVCLYLLTYPREVHYIASLFTIFVLQADLSLQTFLTLLILLSLIRTVYPLFCRSHHTLYFHLTGSIFLFFVYYHPYLDSTLVSLKQRSPFILVIGVEISGSLVSPALTLLWWNSFVDSSVMHESRSTESLWIILLRMSLNLKFVKKC